MLLRSLHIASRQLFYLIVVGIVLSLLGLMGAVWLSDEVAKRKDEIAAWASDKTGYPITIESAGLYWFDLIPKLEVRQAVLLQKTSNTAVVTAEQIYLSLDILASIEQREPVVADASINGVDLSVARDNAGQLRLTGLESGERRVTATTLPDALRWLSWLKQLELADISIDYSDQQRPTIAGRYLLQQANVAFSDNYWQTQASLQLPAHLGNTVNFSGTAEIHSDYTLKAWQGKLLSDDVSIMPLLAEQSLNGALITSGIASLVIQAEQKATGDLSADVNLAVNDLMLLSDKTDEKLEVNALQGRLKWQTQGQTWQLQSEDLQLQVAGQAWPLTSFEVTQSADNVLRVQSNYLRLSDITSLALLMDNMPAPLLTTQPAGDIHELSLNYQLETGLQSIQFKAQEIAMLPWQSYPGVTGLGFELDWQPEQAALTLTSHNTTLYADSWLDDAVYFDSLIGKLSWQQRDGNWHAVADELQVWNEDLQLQLDGRINHQDGISDSDLTLDMQDVVVNRWKKYVPQKVLQDDFKRWANDAFKDGVIRAGQMKLKGDLDAFPFDAASEQGTFDLTLQVENAQLHYAPDWPDISKVDADISVQDDNLIIKSQSGQIAGFAFNNVTTTISNWILSNPILRLNGLMNGTTPQALRFLQNSPLKDRFGSIADWIKVEGNSDIQLQLMVPLINTAATEAEGHVTFAESKLTTSAVPALEINNINGQLKFNNDGVTAEKINARVFDEPVVANVEPEQGQTLIKVNGKTATSKLNEVWPGSIPTFISGETDYLTTIRIREPEEGLFDVGVDIQSDLQGISIEAPEPLTKTAEQAKKLLISISENAAGKMVYRVDFDSWLSTALSINESGMSGQLMLGGERAQHASHGVTIAGNLPELDLDKWLAWQANRSQKQTETAMAINGLNVSLDKVHIGHQTINDVNVEATQTSGYWQLVLDSPQIKGQIGVPQEVTASQPLDIDLAYLKLNLPENKPEQGTSLTSRNLWPSMRLEVTELELDGMRLGHLSLSAKQTQTDWQLESASLKSDVMNASATGAWLKTDTADRSQFDIVVSSDDLKALLAYYNYQQVVEAQQVQLIAKLNWSGDPVAFSRQTLNGELDLTVGRGSLIDVEPGAAGRIFGLLSIAAIPRRLSLDFSDLFGKGFDFSAINGTFDFANGIARTDNLTMQGDSAIIEVTGPVDMINKTYNQVVKVTPKVSSTLPLAGAVAGGPVGLGVGTAILIFDKLAGTLFDREIVNLITYSYQLTGPWDNPKLNILNPATN